MSSQGSWTSWSQIWARGSGDTLDWSPFNLKAHINKWAFTRVQRQPWLDLHPGQTVTCCPQILLLLTSGCSSYHRAGHHIWHHTCISYPINVTKNVEMWQLTRFFHFSWGHFHVMTSHRSRFALLSEKIALDNSWLVLVGRTFSHQAYLAATKTTLLRDSTWKI